MNEETKIRINSKKKIAGKKKLFSSIAALLIVILLFAGLAYAWFANQTDMATLMKISPPATISILGPGGSELTSLDLNYNENDKEGNTVTVRRVICVQSQAEIDEYKLEIVHTTNLKDLTFRLYPVSDNGSSTVTDGTEYKYDPSDVIEGNYLNLNNTDTTSGYKYANNTKHSNNYNTYTNVQSHAEPLYWLVNGSLNPIKSGNLEDKVNIEGKNYYRTYYVCEVTWTEETKETDIFYILAKEVKRG